MCHNLTLVWVCVEGAQEQHVVIARAKRPQLETRIRGALSSRLALLVGAPGYGKSTTLARLLELDGRQAVWHTCAPGESIMEFLGELSERAQDGGQGEARLVLIDEVQHLSTRDFDELVQFLISRLPADWSAALASTVELRHAELLRLLTQGDAVYLDERDLAFDREDARTVAAQLGRSVEAADAAWDRASGWPMGVITLLEGREPWLGDYFRFNVLERLTPRVRQFVEATLVLDVLTARTCQALIGSADAAQLLAEARAAHAFLRQRPDGSAAYLPLFRTAVLEDVRRRCPRRIARLANRAAQRLLQENEPRAAISTVSAGAGWKAGVTLLCRIAPEAIAAGRGADLIDWISVFPGEVVEREPWLQYFKGVGLRLGGEYSAAVVLQEQARDGFRAAAIQEGYAYALAELGTLTCFLDRPAEAEQLLAEARLALSGSDDVHQAAVLCSLADTYVTLNRLREANAAGEQAIALTVSDASSSMAKMHVQALHRIALVRMREGRFPGALEVISRALELAHEHVLDAETMLASALILGIVRWGIGELESAEHGLLLASQQAERQGLTRLKGNIDIARASVLADLGRLEDADHLFASSDPSSEFPGVSREAGVGVLRLLQNRVSEARAIFRDMLETASMAGNAADVARAKAALGVVALRTHRLSEAERWLLDGARDFEQSGARYRLAGTQLFLADLYLASNDIGRCRRNLKAALDYAASADFYHFFFWHSGTMARLGAFAVREGLQADWVEAVCTRRLGPAEAREFLPLLSDPNPRAQAAARRIVDALLSDEGSVTLAGLESCTDEVARDRLTRALVAGCLTARGVLLLRHHYGLTWAETAVFAEYYLTDFAAAPADLEPGRRGLALRLGISENTLRHHITSIRQKLGFETGRGTASVFVWALTSGIATWPPRDTALYGGETSKPNLASTGSASS